MAAKSVSVLDRQAINSLSHPPASSSRTASNQPPLSIRDASIIPRNSRSVWNKPPTAIPIPSNSDNIKMNVNLTPFAAGRFKNTLDSNTQDLYGNRQKRRVLAHPPKRRKTTHGPLLIAKDSQQDINVPNEDDHPQAGSSSYFTRAPPKPSNLRNAPKVAPVTLISSDEEGDCPSAPPDGENSAWLQKKHARKLSSSHSTRSDEVEEISDFSDEKTRSKEPGKLGFVKEQARKLDRQEQDSLDQKIAATVAAIPHLDLTQFSNVKKGMNPRTVTKPKSKTNSIDPIATSSTPYVTSKNTTTTKRNRTIPLKDIYFGLKHLGPGFCIIFNPTSNVQCFFIKGPENYTESVTFAQSVKSIQFGDANFSDPCIKLISKPIPLARRHTGIGEAWGEDFTPGEPGKGEVTVKIDTDDPSWSPEVFNAFRNLCRRVVKNECSVLVGRNSNRALWSSAEQAAGVDEDETIMQNADADSDPLNMNIDVDDVHEFDQLPVSNERSRRDTEPPSQPPSQRKPRTTYTSRKPSSTPESRASIPAVRRSMRQQQNQTKQAEKQPSENPDEIILSYPPAAATGAVKITNADYNRLLPDEYLNDTLIEFGLKLWHHELATEDPELANEIHIFNSFFYKKLNKKNLEEGYQSVRRWTSRFDIFKKKFVIVPINENVHWYLAVIYQPDLVLLPPPERESPNTRHHTRSSNVHEEANSDIRITADTPSPATTTASSNEAEAGSSLSGRRSLSSTAASGSVSRAGSPSEAKPVIEDSKPSSEADAEEAAHGLTAVDISVDVQIPDSMNEPLSPCTSLFYEPMDVDEKLEEDHIVSPSFTSIVTSSRDPRNRSQKDHLHEDEHLSSSRSKTTSVPSASFYAAPARTKKGKGRAVEPSEDAFNAEHVDPHALEIVGQPTAMIFTLDSLGNKHPRVVTTLSKYLQLEAIDKKQLHNTSRALGRNLPVPTQPNFCDCGIYLIHFAQVFVKKAGYLTSISQKKGTRSQADRHADWEAHHLNDFRDELRKKVGELSKSWKAQNSAQQEQETTPAESRGTKADAVVYDLSDSDIDIVETTVTVPQERKTKPKSTSVARVRGN